MLRKALVRRIKQTKNPTTHRARPADRPLEGALDFVADRAHAADVPRLDLRAEHGVRDLRGLLRLGDLRAEVPVDSEHGEQQRDEDAPSHGPEPGDYAALGRALLPPRSRRAPLA